MYRAPDASVRCAACGNTNVTPETKFDPSKGHSLVYFRDPSVPVRALMPPERDRAYAVNRARVCLDCGHVMYFLGPRRRADLAAAIASLAPIGEDE